MLRKLAEAIRDRLVFRLAGWAVGNPRSGREAAAMLCTVTCGPASELSGTGPSRCPRTARVPSAP